MTKNNQRKFIIGTAVAAVAGYVAGVLTAPKSGKETRKDIKNAADKGIAALENELKRLHTQLNEAIEAGKKQVAKLSGSAKNQLNEAISKATTAKQKARQILSAVHEGNASDQDLKKAVSEASKAVDHLKSFLKKS